MNAWLEILRPANGAMSAVAVGIGMLLVAVKLNAVLSPLAIVLGLVAAFFITGAGNAINDYVDVEADKVNRPKRPIPSGRIARQTALGYAALLFALGIFFAAWTVHLTGLWWPVAIAAVNSLLLVLYAARLKETLLLGNVVISYLVGSSFLFGGAIAGDLLLPLLLLLLAALANLGREVAKTLEDLEGDRASVLKKGGAALSRFAGGKLKVGTRVIAAVGAFCLLLAILVSPLPYMLHQLGRSYLFIVAIADLLFLGAMVQLLRAKASAGFHMASKFVKFGMLLGLLAFLIGVLV